MMIKAVITQRQQKNEYDSAVDIMEASYITYFENLGIRLNPISNYTQIPIEHMDGFNLLIITGGGDLSQKCYDDMRVPIEQGERDAIEEKLLKYCFLHNIPILAICRGMQYVNCLLGGKVRALNDLNVPRPIRKDHSVVLCNESRNIMVNNYHNDGIFLGDLAPNLEVFALDMENQIVEAFRNRNKKLLALQWHPERDYEYRLHSKESNTIIKNFLKEFCNYNTEV